ncbi:MAG: hypothetical protein KGR98_06855 [Verrucomicrobia bacterium]|nr:hypothetical protein [Verrucomicrobiota bacterium]MDE3099571.1 hypothetical protein [Verrucomicrobiota bacterium]
MNPMIKKSHLIAALLMGAATFIPAHATTALNGCLLARALTPGEIANTNYSLPSTTETSGGLLNAGLGQPFYLEADVALGIADVTNVSWTLASRPAGSTAALTNSPLGAAVPVYGPANQLVSEAASRMLLRPDVAGPYTVTVTIQTASEGSTNLTLHLTGGTYDGWTTCAYCHQGDVQAPDKVDPWLQTGHATMFSRGIDGLIYKYYGYSCVQCHTLGYDLNDTAYNGGFDDVATQLGWTFPTVLTNGNWASMESNYPTLAALANIQCENCHGAGSEHAYSTYGGFGNTNYITVSMSSGDCAQCHDDPPHHNTVAEWDNSLHAITTRHPAGSADCVGCHTGTGFEQRMDGVTNNLDTSYVSINCQTCHEPHGETAPTNNLHLIRAMTDVTLMDGTVITNGGEGLLCMQCHHSREDAATYATSYHPYFGPHHGPQADMLAGANGFTYGQSIPSSAHIYAVTNLCVTCHMQSVNTSVTVDGVLPLYQHAGGHTFLPSYDSGTNNVDLTTACQQCHGNTIGSSFDFPLQDYDGDGVVEGVQTEVQNLLNKLSTLLPNASGVVDGQVKTPSPTSSWTAPQLEADYNWQFVNNDGSLGIHNTAYAVGLLKASIANLTGVTVTGGLPDAWVLQYWSSVTDPNAAPNADPTGDGIPNWMKYALGLDPLVAATTLTNGVVVGNITGLGDTNTVHIYTAAEVAFDTEVGKTYQIQSISSLSGGWSNVGSPIAGTGSSISFLTPTRHNVHQFFRVITNP